MSGSMRPITRVQVASEMPFGQRAGAKTVAPLIEAGRGGGERQRGMREQGAGAEAGSQQGAAGQAVFENWSGLIGPL